MLGKTIAVGLSFALTALATTAIAAPIKWELQNVVFDDGGSASGSFLFDADTETFSNLNLTTTQGSVLGGNTYEFSGPWASSKAIDSYSAMTSHDLTGEGGLFLILDTAMTNLGGTLSARGWDGTAWNSNLGAGFWAEGICADAKCNDYSAGRQLTSGQITTLPVPLPAGGVFLLTGIFGMAALRRRKTNKA